MQINFRALSVLCFVAILVLNYFPPVSQLNAAYSVSDKKNKPAIQKEIKQLRNEIKQVDKELSNQEGKEWGAYLKDVKGAGRTTAEKIDANRNYREVAEKKRKSSEEYEKLKERYKELKTKLNQSEYELKQLDSKQ